jgi:hypothetical protein
VRSVLVVVLAVDAEHVLEVPSAEDQDPVEAVGADRAHPALGVGVRVRCLDGRVDHSDADPSVAVIAAAIVVFVVGEMLWIPTSQALAAELAPPARRGTYFGALAAMTGPAWTLVPLIALQLRTAVGVAAVWIFFAIAAVVGATVGVAAAHAARAPAKRLR